jgi:hypothetical protein
LNAVPSVFLPLLAGAPLIFGLLVIVFNRVVVVCDAGPGAGDKVRRWRRGPSPTGRSPRQVDALEHLLPAGGAYGLHGFQETLMEHEEEEDGGEAADAVGPGPCDTQVPLALGACRLAFACVLTPLWYWHSGFRLLLLLHASFTAVSMLFSAVAVRRFFDGVMAHFRETEVDREWQVGHWHRHGGDDWGPPIYSLQPPPSDGPWCLLLAIRDIATTSLCAGGGDGVATGGWWGFPLPLVLPCNGTAQHSGVRERSCATIVPRMAVSGGRTHCNHNHGLK